VTTPPAQTSSRPATPIPFASGLSAAFSDEVPVESNLGALGNDAAFSLSSLDGNEDNSPTPSFEPSAEAMPASIGPAMTPAVAKPTQPTKASTEPLDMFAPPDAESHEMNVDLATDEIEHRERKMTPVSTPVSQSIPVTPPPSRRASTPIPVQGGVASTAGDIPRARYAAGVLLAILIGFVPAHLFASMRESKLTAIDQQVIQTQTNASSTEEYAQLDAFRSAQLSKKESEKRTIMLMSLLIWGLAGAGVAYVWFRRVPWDRLGTKTA
jgi:hypothetical protein